MKTKHLVQLSVIALSLLSSCKVEKNCPGFDEADMKEFSYQEPQTLTFENEDSALFEIVITEIIMSESYDVECRDLYRICPCINYVEAVATDPSASKPYVFLRMEQSDVSEMQYFKYTLKDFEFMFDFVNELPHIDEMDMFTYHPSFIVGSKAYYDVVEITNTDEESPGISRVYFTKKDGIIRFIEKDSDMAWNLRIP